MRTDHNGQALLLPEDVAAVGLEPFGRSLTYSNFFGSIPPLEECKPTLGIDL